ncbi:MULTISPECIES: response regulator [Luteibacter]|jgi:two-component system KDP operon response regulator KdpE|uniref:response regulator n=1 Tax=Luteibacter TaxID=242605 RepID=UPI00056AF8BA|nr:MULTISPECIES: response regulator transcription factor [unclassified Luteibacter]MDR6644421.1 two-component system KDP operon response regulator KdpE [Luteibacter sp. 1214]SKB66067.1 two-component system, OmpR family, KDP operon response regulator KdpE [Luteibacter sp. 22Crub2.1]
MNASAPRVLVIDDEAQIRRFLDIGLRAEGYHVLLASTGQEGLGLAATQSPDVVILDIGLPDLEGHDVLREIRQWSQVPVLMLSVRDTEAEKVRALDGGANDYVTKPFGIQELMARLRVLLRQAARGGDAEAAVRYDDGRLAIDLARREVLLDGAPVALTRKEFAVLSLLVRHPGRVVSQQQILREVWGPTHTQDTHYLRIVMGKLRQKLGDDPTTPRWLRTEPGVGYRFPAG